MKIAARVFYEAQRTYNKLLATDVKDFMVGKDFNLLTSAMKTQISTIKEGDVTVFIRTNAGTAKPIMRQIIPGDEVQAVIDEWADNKAFTKLADDCLEYVYDKLAGVV